MLKASRAWAAIHGRDFVTPDDVQAIVVPALAHRLILNPDDWLRGMSPDTVVRQAVAAVPTPRAVEG